jgi:hypothetical protein
MTSNDREATWSVFTKRVIPDIFTGEPYLVRWTLLSTPWFSIKIHHILKADGGRDLHDHPWWFLSFVLRGRYVEKVPAPEKNARDMVEHREIRRFRFNFKRAEGLHSIVDVSPGGAWTLVLTGPRIREWGFRVWDYWDGTWYCDWLKWDEWIAEQRMKDGEMDRILWLIDRHVAPREKPENTPSAT